MAVSATIIKVVGPIIAIAAISWGAATTLAASTMSVRDFLLNMDKLKGEVVTVHGQAACDSPDLCVLYEVARTVAFDPSGLPRETQRRLRACGRPYRCHLLVTGLVQASPNFGALLIASAVEW
jgi:hypothetical protein